MRQLASASSGAVVYLFIYYLLFDVCSERSCVVHLRCIDGVKNIEINFG